jgi:cold shock CspA family protein
MRSKGSAFIQTQAGREPYFHADSVIDGTFDALRVGDGVRFGEGAGERGPQARPVHLARR